MKLDQITKNNMIILMLVLEGENDDTVETNAFIYYLQTAWS